MATKIDMERSAHNLDVDAVAEAAADAAYEKADRQDSVGMRALAGLFLLEHEFRRVPRHQHLARLIVNRLNRFAPYDCALFWTCSRRGRIYDVTISGVAKSRGTKPVLKWGRGVAKWLSKSKWTNTQISPSLIGERRLKNWPVNIPKSGLYVPMHGMDAKLRGGILLLRDTGWSQPARVMLNQLAEAAAYTLDALDTGVHGRLAARGKRKFWLLSFVTIALLGGGFFIPVETSVTVPAQLAVPDGLKRAPQGSRRIDLAVAPQNAIVLQQGSRLITTYKGKTYELEVEYISPWLSESLNDRHVRARVIGRGTQVPAGLKQVMIENASVPLPVYGLYWVSGFVSASLDALGKSPLFQIWR